MLAELGPAGNMLDLHANNDNKTEDSTTKQFRPEIW